MSSLIPVFIQQQYQQKRDSGRFFATTLHVELIGLLPIAHQFLEKGSHHAKTLTDLMHAVFQPLLDTVSAHDGFTGHFTQSGFTAFFPDNQGRSGRESIWRGLTTAIHLQGALVRTLYTELDEHYPLSLKLGLSNGLVEWGILHPPTAEVAPLRYYLGGTAVRDCLHAVRFAESGDIVLSGYVRQELDQFLETKPLSDGFWLLSRLPSVPPAPAVTTRAEDDLAVIAPFVLPQISQQPASGEFCPVATLALNFKDAFTYTQINHYAQIVFQLQERYRGYLQKILLTPFGCTFSIYWGMPDLFENDLKRASNFLSDLSRLVTKPFRAGLTYDVAYTGFIGGHTLQDYGCLGETVDLAHRFMDRAEWGELWVSEAIYQRTADQFVLEDLGEHHFSGIAAPQAVYNLRGLRSSHSKDGSRYLIGRQQQLASLIAFIEPIFQNSFAGVLAIVGEAGIGKSYLVHTVHQHLQYHPIASKNEPVLLRFQGDEFSQQPLTALRQMLRRYFNVSPSYSPGINERHFDSVWKFMLEVADTPLRAELERTHPFTAALVNLMVRSDVLEQVDGSLRLQNISTALITLIKAQCMTRPVIIHIEDSQWLDGESRQILSELANHLHLQQIGYAAAIVITSRQNAKSTAALIDNFVSGISHKTVTLYPLERHDIQRLAEYTLNQLVSPSLLDLLETHTKGNPLFIEQILLYLQEKRVLSNSARGMAVANEFVSGLVLPASIQAALIARIERLKPEERKVVHAAAVIGNEFSLTLLEAVLDLDRSILLLYIAIGVENGLWSATDQDEEHYLFDHAILCEAAYNMQFVDQRKQLHGRIAQTIERVFVLDLHDYYGELAYHYQKIDDTEKERFFTLLAGDEATKQFANQTALRFYTRALELIPAGAWEVRFIVLQKRETVLSYQGRRAEQLQDLEMMSQIVSHLSDQSADDQIRQGELALRYAQYASSVYDHTAAVEHAQTVVRRAHASQSTALQIEGYLILGQSLYQLGRYAESEEGMLQCLALVQNLSSRGYVYGILGDIASAKNEWAAAESHYEEALRYKIEGNDVHGEAEVRFRYSLYHQRYGDYAMAIALQVEALAIFQKLGDRAAEAMCYLQHGRSYYSIGNYTRAREEYGEAFRLSCEIQEQRLVGLTLAYQGLLSHVLSNHAVAEVQATQANLIAKESEDSFLLGLSGLVLGDVLLGQNEPAKAALYFQASLESFHKWGDVRYAIQAMSGLARAKFGEGDRAQALSYAELIMTRLHDDEKINQHRAAPKLYLACYRILNAYLDKRRRPVLKRGYETLLAQAEKISDQEMRRTFLHNVPAHREIRAAYAIVFE